MVNYKVYKSFMYHCYNCGLVCEISYDGVKPVNDEVIHVSQYARYYESYENKRIYNIDECLCGKCLKEMYDNNVLEQSADLRELLFISDEIEDEKKDCFNHIRNMAKETVDKLILEYDPMQQDENLVNRILKNQNAKNPNKRIKIVSKMVSESKDVFVKRIVDELKRNDLKKVVEAYNSDISKVQQEFLDFINKNYQESCILVKRIPLGYIYNPDYHEIDDHYILNSKTIEDDDFYFVDEIEKNYLEDVIDDFKIELSGAFEEAESIDSYVENVKQKISDSVGKHFK